MKHAMFYQPSKNHIRCTLCPHYCLIQENHVGACAVRKNIKGKLYSLVYGQVIAKHMDPIEKKPLFHFMPGSKIYSFATAGCNFKCEFCQNWQISQISKGATGKIIGEHMSPKSIVKEAISAGCASIAMTYVEPTIFYEYALDTCKLAKKNKLNTVFVSNGYINKQPIDEIQPYLDAINIDLKSFSDEFYKKVCGGRLAPVLDSIKYYHSRGIWVEVTTLVIPHKNDSDKELKAIAEFIASIDLEMPWHVSRFHPDYQMLDQNPTPLSTLLKAYELGKAAGLKYVYIGNVPGHDNENTYCPDCKKLIIGRQGFNIVKNNMSKNRCKFCNRKINGIFL